MLITYENITEKQQQCLMVMRKYPQSCENTSVGLAMDPTSHMSKHLNKLKFCLAKKGFYPMNIINLVSECLKRDSQTVYNCGGDVETNCYQLIQTHINCFRFIIQRKNNCCSSRRYRHCSYDALSLERRDVWLNILPNKLEPWMEHTVSCTKFGSNKGSSLACSCCLAET